VTGSVPGPAPGPVRAPALATTPDTRTDLVLRALLPEHLEVARALLARGCAHDAAARVAAEKLSGPAAAYADAQALGAWRGAELAGVVAVSGPWIRLLAVDPVWRGLGVGSALLAAAEQAITAAGARTVHVLDQPGNYLAPGIDVRNAETIAWLERRGYARRGERTNLLIDLGLGLRPDSLDQDAQLRATRARAAVSPAYELRRATAADADTLASMIAPAFSAAWAFEVGQALRCEPPAVHVAVERASGAFVAFAAHDGNNRGLGWFGPTGTLPGHRGRGLGAALLWACLEDVAAAGHEVCEVAWIGPRDFYERAAGVAGERRFVAMRKEIP
jgi:predicted N-acetyltransferase YhbS